MSFIKGQNRDQLVLFPTSLNDFIDSTNEVRQIEMFVNSLNMSEMGFKTVGKSTEGRPGYNPADLLKLYIYGYMNKVRSSRELEKESKRNIEVMWLLHNLKPDHNTISNFRRDNPEAIRKVFRKTVEIAMNYNLIGGTLLAGDSVKLRAQNSKKNNYNADKIERHVAYIEQKLSEYNTILAESDDEKEKKEVTEKIQKQQEHKEKYQNLSQTLKESGEYQISTSDPDSRQMIVRNNITEVAYNIQAIDDAKHCLILDYQPTQHNDTHALYEMVSRASIILQHTNFMVLYDKGYHTASEIAACHQLGVETLVAIPARPVSSQSPNPAFNFESFTYNQTTDTYTCPAGKELKTNGTVYTSKSSDFKQYKTSQCKQCPLKSECTTSSKNGRVIQRSAHIENTERNKNMIEKYKEIYKKRQSIVEHPFGTIKRQWGFDHTIMKRGIDIPKLHFTKIDEYTVKNECEQWKLL